MVDINALKQLSFKSNKEDVVKSDPVSEFVSLYY